MSRLRSGSTSGKRRFRLVPADEDAALVPTPQYRGDAADDDDDDDAAAAVRRRDGATAMTLRRRDIIVE
jgi:hypothetical protein